MQLTSPEPTFWISPDGRPDSSRLAAMLAERLKPHEQLLAYTTLAKLPLMLATKLAHWMAPMAELLDALEARALGRPQPPQAATLETQSLPKVATQLIHFAMQYDVASGARIIATVSEHWMSMHPDVSRAAATKSLLASWLQLTQARLAAGKRDVAGPTLPPWLDDGREFPKARGLAEDVPQPVVVAGAWSDEPF